ncbi:MAG: hypothetical protein RSE93_07985, partial [Oscillospiraceae bacterium]
MLKDPLYNNINFDNLTIIINKAIKDTNGASIVGEPKSKAGYCTIIFDNELKEILLSINRNIAYTKNRQKISFVSKLV